MNCQMFFFCVKIKSEREEKNMYNPYGNGIYNNYPNNYQNNNFYARQEIAKVNGENGARAYQIAPNSSVLLLDEVNPIIYLKTSDSGGYASVTAYSITPYQKEEPIDVKSLESRIAKLEEVLNESNLTSVKHDKTE